MLSKIYSFSNIAIVTLLICFSFSNSIDCDEKLGCLLKKKFFSFVSNADTRGNPHSLESTTNYKNVYSFNDKLVFFKASLPQENISEQEIPGLNTQMNEAHIQRFVPFRHIRLECGKFQTRLCHAKDLPSITKSDAFKKIKLKIADADDKCLAFTFLEESFNKVTNKIAIICITDPRQVKELLIFKNFVSRSISKYHLLEAHNRFDASAGLELGNGHFITYFKEKTIPVYASLRSKSILLLTDDVKRSYVKEIKFLGLRNTGAWSVRKANELKKLKQGWADKLGIPPSVDCCIVMPSK